MFLWVMTWKLAFLPKSPYPEALDPTLELKENSEALAAEVCVRLTVDGSRKGSKDLPCLKKNMMFLLLREVSYLRRYQKHRTEILKPSAKTRGRKWTV